MGREIISMPIFPAFAAFAEPSSSGPVKHAGRYRPHPCGRPFGPTFRRSTSLPAMLSITARANGS